MNQVIVDYSGDLSKIKVTETKIIVYGEEGLEQLVKVVRDCWSKKQILTLYDTVMFKLPIESSEVVAIR